MHGTEGPNTAPEPANKDKRAETPAPPREQAAEPPRVRQPSAVARPWTALGYSVTVHREPKLRAESVKRLEVKPRPTLRQGERGRNHQGVAKELGSVLPGRRVTRSGRGHRPEQREIP